MISNSTFNAPGFSYWINDDHCKLFAIRYSIKLNFKYLFKASTFLILGLSTIFLGKGIGALQKTGVLDQTRINYSVALGVVVFGWSLVRRVFF